MKIRLSVTALALLSFSSAQAFCFAEAANRYGVDEQLLIAIAKVESNFNPKARHINKDKTWDTGLMQINSSLLPKLSKYQITEQSLLNPCTSAHLGAWVLAQSIRFYGPTWRAVGGYGAGLLPEKEVARQVYAGKVERALAQLKKTPFNPNSVGSVTTKPTMQVIE
jgi:soluble lytic murein transglycosylase-like protein